MTDSELCAMLEPILRFCLARLNSRAEAEDLAGEIILAALEGSRKYEIASPEAWVWRIARNRYARYLSKRRIEQSLNEEFEPADESDFVGELIRREEYDGIFRALHSLSEDYRRLTIAHHLDGLSVAELARRYSLPETTIKWRLNVSRQRIRERMEFMSTERIYSRINLKTTACNGAFDSDRYLHSQLARAICLAAYESPATVEQISLATGIPALYIEDSLTELIYGDAISEAVGSREPKYATEFIILRLRERARLEKLLTPHIAGISAHFEALLPSVASELEELGFYGCENETARLGWLIVPLVMRGAIDSVMKRSADFGEGAYPPRKDGGYGWFIVDETLDSEERVSPHATGCNSALGDGFRILYHWVGRHLDSSLYHGYGTKRLCTLGIPGESGESRIPEGRIDDETLARFVEVGLVNRIEGEFRLAFPIFTKAQFEQFNRITSRGREALEAVIARLLPELKREFESFVPKRLYSQLNQRISCFAGELIGMTCDRLSSRGLLCESPRTEGICAIIG